MLMVGGVVVDEGEGDEGGDCGELLIDVFTG